ncbi:MAG: preprotein translocase subunit Sec61beta [Candidatus Aenigmarchaeota archaeon]|nr:preprotein translocase subunit Sec61beta [Candidatus Aenigmarchaeota archaeon]
MSSKKDKMYMPSGIGGLIRYNEEEKEVLKLKPKHVVFIVLGLATVEILLKILVA